MNNDSDVIALAHHVLWAAFGLGLLLGALMQRTQFCSMGAVADIVNFGDWGRMRMWLLAIATAVLGTNALAAAGLIDPLQSIYAAPPLLWGSALLGGLLFGFGMVLASGCGSKTLVRLGSGSLKALLVFMLIGVSGWATMRGITAVLRVAGPDRLNINLGTSQDLPSLLSASVGLPLAHSRLLLGGAVGLALAAWALAARGTRETRQFIGGCGVGALVVALWWVSGHFGYLSEDPRTLQPAFLGSTTNHMESFTFVAPLANTLSWLLLFSDSSNVINLGIASVFGVVLGAAASALLGGHFRWEGMSGLEDTANHMIGAVLMGIGGVTAMGCTIGQGISGVSTLSLTSWLALGAIVLGATAGVRFQSWRLQRAA